MCVFTAFWMGLTFLLAAAPFSLPASQIGLVSLPGVLGVIGAQFTGRVYNRGWSVPAIGIGLAITLISLGISGFGESSMVAILIAISLLSVGAQSVLVLLQTMMVSIDPAARSRLNSSHIVCNFIGGAIGSTLAAVLWQVGRWPAIMSASALVVVFALVLWFIQRKRALSEYKQTSSVTSAAEDVCPPSAQEYERQGQNDSVA